MMNIMQVVGRPLLCALPLVVSACAGEPRVLPPRTPPARQLPALALPRTPVAADHGRVVLDTTDGPMRVVAEYDPSFAPPGAPPVTTRTGELCVTPCVADLPVGRYRLYLSSVSGDGRGDTDDLVVGEGLSAYRRAPGKYTTPTITNGIAPGALLIASMLAIAFGGALLGQSDGDGGSTPGGLVLVGAGVGGLIGGGIWAYDASRAEQQEGSSTTWQVPMR